MLKIFSLLKVRFQFDNDDSTVVWIQCNSCNKTITCQFFETILIEFLQVFIKAVVFHHLSLSCSLETKEQ